MKCHIYWMYSKSYPCLLFIAGQRFFQITKSCLNIILLTFTDWLTFPHWHYNSAGIWIWVFKLEQQQQQQQNKKSFYCNHQQEKTCHIVFFFLCSLVPHKSMITDVGIVCAILPWLHLFIWMQINLALILILLLWCYLFWAEQICQAMVLRIIQ